MEGAQKELNNLLPVALVAAFKTPHHGCILLRLVLRLDLPQVMHRLVPRTGMLDLVENDVAVVRAPPELAGPICVRPPASFVELRRESHGYVF